MKQHITVEQLNELTNTQLLKLINILYNKNYKESDIEGRGSAGITIKDCVYFASDISDYKCNIGKMIEILDSHHSELANVLDIYKNDLDEWCITIDVYGEVVLLGLDDELCNALWDAVKLIN